MVKRVCAIVIAAIFLFAALPMLAEAAQPFAPQQLIKKSIAGLQQQIFAEDSSALSAITVQFLDDILAAGQEDNKADLQLIVMRYVSDVQEIQAIDPSTQCGISSAISLGSAAVGMITEVTSGNSSSCIVVNLTNKAADIMAAQTKYSICLIDDAGGTGDRAALVKKLQGIEIYDFATNAIDVFLCIEAPGIMDYFGLVMNLIGIFTVK